ncbi:MAG TPA: helix-turn-helix transcriptional regulator [Alphaproteobacteria bacterium]|nr:helix-turn-helix transcriptional regulator [Alphaproteobacteria bacterium]
MTRRSNAARKGNTVEIPRAKYEEILERLEDLEDALRLNRLEAESNPRDHLPVELVKRMIAGESLVRIWREHRGLTITALSERSGVGISYISEIESGKKPGSVDALKRLADALDLRIDDLVR